MPRAAPVTIATGALKAGADKKHLAGSMWLHGRAEVFRAIERARGLAVGLRESIMKGIR